MAAALVTVSNVSRQVVPILVNEISTANANDASDIPAARAEQMALAPNSQVTIESARVDLAHLEQLQRKKLITFVAR